MSDPSELAELDSLLTSGGWQRLTAHFDQEWGLAGQSYQDAIRKAIGGPVGTEADAVQRLKCVTYAQSALEAFLRWPAERIAQLRSRSDRETASAGPSRRGPGL